MKPEWDMHRWEVGDRVRRVDDPDAPTMSVARIDTNGDLLLSYGGHVGWRCDPADAVCASDWCECGGPA